MGASEGVDPWAALLDGLNERAWVGQESRCPDHPQNVLVVPSPSSLSPNHDLREDIYKPPICIKLS